MSPPDVRMVDRIVAWRDDPDTASLLHRLDHDGGLDMLVIAEADLGRRRFQATTENGMPVQVALPRSERLADGAVLHLDERQALVVRVGAPAWLDLEPLDRASALELGYAAGNLHWRVTFSDGRVQVALDSGDAESYLARLAPLDGRFRVVS
ncbi:urease accessory protein UreE [Minwuia sp.]|uniref:urease accessory protein UreE n=1 Tax=Minwuia sp. TaxID=2493630 RepID=UPI003A910235